VANSSPGLIRRSLRFCWRVVDTSRRITVNLLFLLIAVAVLVAFFTVGPHKLDDKTALVLDLRGTLVEQEAAGARELALAEARGDTKSTTRLRDVLRALALAAKDEHITSVLLMTDELHNAGLPMLHEVALALERFKASGKPVIAWGSHYDQRQYYLAAHATQAYLHPMGLVMIEGFGGYRNYYRDALDKLGVSVNVIRVGTYKSFGEPFTANGPSPEAAEADNFLLKDLWATYTGEVEKARKLPAGALMKSIDQLPEMMKAVDGDAAKLAQNAKLVDGLKTRDELRDLMLARGAPDAAGKTFRQMGMGEFLAQHRPLPYGPAVGVVVAMGDISDGMADAGQIGGLSTSQLVRKAREDDNVKAVVLRVDSPGGSAFGSELIRRELELTRQAGKPVVVSMGNVAASGGYWISMAADEVMADAATITGSIGVFSILPTADKGLDKLGVHTGGATTTWLRGAYDPRRPLEPRLAEVIQSGINHVYADFTGRAAKARKTTPDKIDAVAQGRVWSGQQALARGLVDSVGSYVDALKSAAQRAKLEEGDYRVAYIERDASRLDRLFNFVSGGTASAGAPWLAAWLQAANLEPLQFAPEAARDMAGDLAWLAQAARGDMAFTPLTHCLCRQP
jgi:protease-4